MTGYIPNEAFPVRATFWSLGVEPIVEPKPPAPPPPPIPAVYYRIAERIREFEHQNERVLCWILYEVERLIVYASPNFIDKDDAETLLAEAVFKARKWMMQPTPEECYELERWVDFLPDAYDARVKRDDLWNAQWQADHERRVAAAKKGVETRRRKREAAKSS